MLNKNQLKWINVRPTTLNLLEETGKNTSRYRQRQQLSA
jgi:hypothetical protein